MSTITITNPTIGLYDLLVTYLGNSNVGDLTLNSPTITNIADTSFINLNDMILGDNIVSGSYIVSKTATSITLSQNVTLTSLLQTFYTHKNNIFLGYQNNYSLPKDNDFIIVTAQTPRINHYGTTTIDTTNDTTTSQTMRDTLYQLDFYGQNAQNNAITIQHLFLTPVATDFLTTYNVSGHEVSDITNLTDPLDVDNYINRYTMKISLFNNMILTNNWLYTDATDVTLIKV